jgi:hypothetical protein
MNQEQEKTIKTILMRHARGLGIPEGAAESFIKEAILRAKKSLKDKTNPTDKMISSAIIKELKKFSPDLAYIYQNCDKII